MDHTRYLLIRARLSCMLKCLLLLFFCAFLKSHSSHSYLTFSLIVLLDQIVFYLYVRTQSVKFVMSQIVINGLRLIAWPLPLDLLLFWSLYLWIPFWCSGYIGLWFPRLSHVSYSGIALTHADPLGQGPPERPSLPPLHILPPNPHKISRITPT